VTLPKPMTSVAKAAGRFGKQDFIYVAADDVYRCPAGERFITNVEDGKALRRCWTSSCKTCALKAQRTTGPERRISRWEHEAVLEKVQARLDHTPLQWVSAVRQPRIKEGSCGAPPHWVSLGPEIAVRLCKRVTFSRDRTFYPTHRQRCVTRWKFPRPTL
jgi:hypothetical protein